MQGFFFGILTVFCLGVSSIAVGITGVEGLSFGNTPEEVAGLWKTRYTYKPPATGPDSSFGKVVYEMQYTGNFQNTYPGLISTIFYMGRLFSVAVSYPSNSSRPASQMFEELVAKVSAMYGPPQSRTYPKEMHSLIALKDIAPIANMPTEPAQLLDLQIRTGFWIPSADWTYKNGTSIKVLIQKGTDKQGAMPALMPLVVFTKANVLN